MDRTDSSRLGSILHPLPFIVFFVSLYAAIALGWVVFARWVVPPMLTVEHPGQVIAAVNRMIHVPPAPFLTGDILGCWRDFSWGVLTAWVLHLTIILIVHHDFVRPAEGRSSTEVKAGRRISLLLLIIAFAFLAVTVVSGPIHDYFFYLQMWYEVRLGHDPWFTVPGMNGQAPLNAYGPLFNLLAGLAWVNPLAPKLLFAYGYILFAISQIKYFAGGRPPSGPGLIVLTALFWNPFPWVEVAFRGHFDILVGLFCLWAIRRRVRGHDGLSGISLALGVLLKYIPVVLLPFLAFDRGRPRPRFIIVATASIALGLALSCSWWGMSTLLPLQFAATRRSTDLSIFFFMRAGFSPLRWFGVHTPYDHLSPLFMGLALLRAWSWYWVRKPDVEAAALVAVVMTVLFYRTGYPQYLMVPFVLGSSWTVRHWGEIKSRAAPVVAIACYFGWLAAFDLYYGLVDEGRSNLNWYLVRQAVGLPNFIFGCAFVAAVVWTSTPGDGVFAHPPEGVEPTGSGSSASR